MAQRLPVIRQVPEDWLDWSAHLGGGAEAVRAVWPAARRRVAEPTPALLARSQQAARRPWWHWPRSAGAAAAPCLDTALPPGEAAMVWANMALHLAPSQPEMLAAWHRALAPQGLLMFSTFGPDTARALHALYAANGWPAPQVPFVDMHDVGDALVQAGFAEPVMDQETVVLTWSSAEALLAELRGLGGNLSPGRTPGLRGRAWRQQLLDGLAQLAGPDGRLSLGFELVYGHAYKGQARQRSGDPAVVDLSGLRSKLRQP